MKAFQIKNKLTVNKQDLENVDVSNIPETTDQLGQVIEQISSVTLKTDICYLKTQSKSFKQFELRFDGDALNFHRQSKSNLKHGSKYTNNLQGVHIISDVQPTECKKTGDSFYSLALFLPTDEARVIYFKSEKLRSYWYNRLLLAQGFTCGIDQYKITPKPIQEARDCSLMYATHRATGREVAIKAVDKENTDEKIVTQFKHEAAILHRMKDNHVLQLIEAIET